MLPPRGFQLGMRGRRPAQFIQTGFTPPWSSIVQILTPGEWVTTTLGDYPSATWLLTWNFPLIVNIAQLRELTEFRVAERGRHEYKPREPRHRRTSDVPDPHHYPAEYAAVTRILINHGENMGW